MDLKNLGNLFKSTGSSRHESAGSKYLDFSSVFDSPCFCNKIALQHGNERLKGTKPNSEILKYMKDEKRALCVSECEELGGKIMRIVSMNNSPRKKKNGKKEKAKEKVAVESHLLMSVVLKSLVIGTEEVIWKLEKEGNGNKKEKKKKKKKKKKVIVVLVLTSRKIYFVIDRRNEEISEEEEDNYDVPSTPMVAKLEKLFEDEDFSDFSSDEGEELEDEEEQKKEMEEERGDFELIKFGKYSNDKVNNPVDPNELIFISLEGSGSEKKKNLFGLVGLGKRKQEFIVLMFEGVKIKITLQNKNLVHKCYEILNSVYFYSNKTLSVTKPPYFNLYNQQINPKDNELAVYFKFSGKKKDFICVAPDSHLNKIQVDLRLEKVKRKKTEKKSSLIQVFKVRDPSSRISKKLTGIKTFYVKYLLMLGGINSICVDDQFIVRKYGEKFSSKIADLSSMLQNNAVSFYQRYITCSPLRFKIKFNAFKEGVSLTMTQGSNRKLHIGSPVSPIATKLKFFPSSISCSAIASLKGSIQASMRVDLRGKLGSRKKRSALNLEILQRQDRRIVNNEPYLTMKHDFEKFQSTIYMKLLEKEIERDFRIKKKKGVEADQNVDYIVNFSGRLESLKEERTRSKKRDLVFLIVQRRELNCFKIIFSVYELVDDTKLVKIKSYLFRKICGIRLCPQKKKVVMSVLRGNDSYTFCKKSEFNAFAKSVKSIWKTIDPFLVKTQKFSLKINNYDFLNISGMKGRFTGYMNACGFDYFKFENKNFEIKVLKYLEYFHNVKSIFLSDSINFEYKKKTSKDCWLVCTGFAFFVFKKGSKGLIEILSRTKVKDVIDYHMEKTKKGFIKKKWVSQFQFLLRNGETVCFEANQKSHPFYLGKVLKEYYDLTSSTNPLLQQRNNKKKKPGVQFQSLLERICANLKNISVLSECWYELYHAIHLKKYSQKKNPELGEIALIRFLASRKEKLKIMRDLDKVKSRDKLHEMRKRIFYYSPLTAIDFYHCFLSYLQVFQTYFSSLPSLFDDNGSFVELFDWLLVREEKIKNFQCVNLEIQKLIESSANNEVLSENGLSLISPLKERAVKKEKKRKENKNNVENCASV